MCGHVLVAVIHFLRMSSVDDTPSPKLISQDIWMQSDAERMSTLIAQVVDT